MTRASSDALVDVLVVGAGAAGMMAAIEAGRRGRRVRVVDHADRPGEKIRISGGGRCNFTNLGCGPANFLGENPRFATSALRRYTQHDFVKRIDGAGIAWHEKTQNGRSLGQLFCDDSAKQIVRMLTDDMAAAGVVLSLKTGVTRIERSGEGFTVILSDGSQVTATSLVVATGGKSIPKMGATGWAYEVARQFDIRVTETRPALVPLTFEAGLLETLTPLAGVAVDASVASAPEGAKTRKASFNEAMLFTHRGLSGPAILQISSYWREGEAVVASMAPGRDVFEELKAAKASNGKQAVHTALGHIVPRRLAESLCQREGASGNLADLSDKVLRRLDQAVNAWAVKPVGSEGYRTAEVTLGGVDTAALDQQTMQAKAVTGLYFIGEAVDVTGWLGGYNFQWAWSSGWAAGQVC
ncbi:NAD(P)/FAD-dependent oxidoreductase [uncultured Brevundimonas sp.]|uniref:NAD(P)/FAD-dependent oxidoreductase n=1 Tax=uncultured Brevundimonas sp. TaxID=213418 RepID=UPI0025EB1F19|nr:NAD(P)/FAD-dependent oxidoreductase [uncultured Brevundimonas sp.]